jgi:hypothetical protein
METRTLSFTLPGELADKLEQAMKSDHVSLEQIAIGWLFLGTGNLRTRSAAAHQYCHPETRLAPRERLTSPPGVQLFL